MKIDLVKTAMNKLYPADEKAEKQIAKLKTGQNYKANITLDQNYKLLQKVWVFCRYCAQHYFGDQNVDEYQVEYVKSQLLIAAGYVRTLVDPRNGHIEIMPISISYDKMEEEERRDCYQKLVTAACNNVFHDASNEKWNELMRFF